MPLPRDPRLILGPTVLRLQTLLAWCPTDPSRSHRVLLPVSQPSFLEPVSGFEPLVCRLQEVRPRAPHAIAAPMVRVIALTALAALGSSGAPFHEPFHAHGHYFRPPVTVRNLIRERGLRTHKDPVMPARGDGGPVRHIRLPVRPGGPEHPGSHSVTYGHSTLSRLSKNRGAPVSHYATQRTKGKSAAKYSEIPYVTSVDINLRGNKGNKNWDNLGETGFSFIILSSRAIRSASVHCETSSVFLMTMDNGVSTTLATLSTTRRLAQAAKELQWPGGGANDRVLGWGE